MSEEEYRFLLRHCAALLEIKRFADSLGQLCFQMERLWFYLFERKVTEATGWFDECATKTLRFGRVEIASREVQEAWEAGEAESSRIENLLRLFVLARQCAGALHKHTNPDGTARAGGEYYRLTLDGEHHCEDLSDVIASLFAAAQQRAAE